MKRKTLLINFEFIECCHQVLATCFVRKIMDNIFTQQELYWLDDILPGTKIGRIRRMSAARSVRIPKLVDQEEKDTITVSIESISFFFFFTSLHFLIEKQKKIFEFNFQFPLLKFNAEIVENNLHSIDEVRLTKENKCTMIFC